MIDIEKYKIILIGSGLASYSICKSLANFKIPILILESGKESFDEKYSILAEHNEIGDLKKNYYKHHSTRMIGGASNVWAGHASVPTIYDIEKISDLPSFPIDYLEIKKYYQKVLRQFYNLNLDEYNSFNNFISKKDDFNFSPHFYNTQKVISLEDFNQFNNVKVYTETTLLNIYSDYRKKINKIKIFNKNKIQYLKIENQIIIFACGGVGNPGIILQPNKDSDIQFGNESGLVGKYLMDHPHFWDNTLIFKKKLLPNGFNKNENYRAAFVPNINILNYNKILSHNIYISKDIYDYQYTNNMFTEILGDELLIGNLGITCEQRPEKNNCISISKEKNFLNLFKLNINNKYPKEIISSAKLIFDLFGIYLQKKNLGILKNNPKIYTKLRGQGHIMGTTKMGSSIKDSVCDKNCKVHGYENFFILGSSLYPRGGSFHPTLLIMALGLRLGDYLKKSMNI